MTPGKKKGTRAHHSELTRLTFRLSDDTVAAFKTIAAIKRMKLEELGEEAIYDLIKKHKPTLKNFQTMID
jgi:predicted transcriptional regulator